MLLDLFFPRICVGCRQELPSGMLCERCFRLFPLPQAPRCPHCDRRIPGGTLAESCAADLRIQRLFVGGLYRHPLLRETIDALKFDGLKELAQPLGRLVAAALTSSVDAQELRHLVLVPVPLHNRRLRERGFNQSELLARNIATLLEIPCDVRLLTRIRNTAQQAKLNHRDRNENMRSAFRGTIPEAMREKIFVLVDDVITSGSTVRGAARALRQEGAKEIWAAAVAQG